jgi:RNA polymerase sigma factor (sigma-70 family)
MGDESEALIERLESSRERFVAFVQSKVSDPDAAEEIMQDSMVRALQGAGRLRAQEKLISWFYTVLRNTITDYYRGSARDSRTLVSTLPEDLPEEDEAEYQTLCLCFQPLIDTLKPEYAQLIRTLDLEGELPEEVASRLGLTSNNLKVRRHRARQALRRRLEATCRVCAEHHCVDCTCREEAAVSGDLLRQV